MSLLLQLAVLPVLPPLPRELLSDTINGVSLQLEFCAGGSGGTALRIVDEAPEERMHLHQVVMGIVQVLSSKELESVSIVGELFASLLLSYMKIRRGEVQTNATLPLDSTIEELKVLETLKEPQDALGMEMTLSLLIAIIESLGPSVLRSAETVTQCIQTVLELFVHTTIKIVDEATSTQQTEDEDEDEDDEILTVCLGVVMTILEAGASKRSDSEEAQLHGLLPVLEQLSQYPRPQIAELASLVRVTILSRGVTTQTNSMKQEKSFQQVLQGAEDDLKSPLVPLRARGVVSLTKLVRTSQQYRGDAQWRDYIIALVEMFIMHLEDSESYVFLAAVQGLSTLSDVHPDVTIPLLLSAVRNKSLSLEQRIKLSEALLFTAKRCGEVLPQYAKGFVYAYLDCIRPPPRRSSSKQSKYQLIQEIDSSSSTETNSSPSPSDQERNIVSTEATLRASCLSNLAEVSAMLGYALTPYVQDVMSCVFGIVQLELDLQSQSVVAVRRGAVFLIKYMLQLMGYKILEVLQDQLKEMYHTLKHVHRIDTDQVVRFHTQQALEVLDGIMRAELFPPVLVEETTGLSSLRIL